MTYLNIILLSIVVFIIEVFLRQQLLLYPWRKWNVNINRQKNSRCFLWTLVAVTVTPPGMGCDTKWPVLVSLQCKFWLHFYLKVYVIQTINANN